MCPACAAFLITVTLFGAGTASTAALGVALVKRARSIVALDSNPNQMEPKERNQDESDLS